MLNTPKWPPHLFFDLLGFAWAQCYMCTYLVLLPSHNNKMATPFQKQKNKKKQGYPTTCFQLNKEKPYLCVSSAMTTSMQRQKAKAKNNNNKKKFALKVRFAIIFTPMVMS